MLKTIARITWILLFAGLISGALYLLVNSPVQLKNPLLSGGDIGEHLSTEDSAGYGFDEPGFAGRRGGRHLDASGGQGLHDFEPTIGFFGLLQNIGVIAFITLGVVVIQKLFRLVFRKKKPAPSCEINRL